MSTSKLPEVHEDEHAPVSDIMDKSNPISLYRTLTTEEAKHIEKTLLHKIDTRILPVIVLIYILYYVWDDHQPLPLINTNAWLARSNSITQARLYGIQQDAHIQGAVWQTANSILSVGHIAMQIPSTLYMAAISYSHFFPTLIKDLGITNSTTTLLLTSPPYCASFVWALSIGFIADRRQVRSTYAGIFAIIALNGGTAIVAIPDGNQWAQYAMMFLLVCGTCGVYCTIYTWLSSTIPKPPQKRAASIGIANSMANLASFYGIYFGLDQYGPDYKQSWGCVIAFIVLCFACIMGLRFSLGRHNKHFKVLAKQHESGQINEHQLKEDELRAVINGFRFVM